MLGKRNSKDNIIFLYLPWERFLQNNGETFLIYQKMFVLKILISKIGNKFCPH